MSDTNDAARDATARLEANDEVRSWSAPTVPVQDIDSTLLWWLRRMMDEWGPAGVKSAVDAIVEAESVHG